MKYVIKKKGNVVRADLLSEENPNIQELMQKGLVGKTDDGRFEIFSLEAKEGLGEIAEEGDYVKYSSTGEPYPNKAWDFEENHRHLEGNLYEEIPKVMKAWTAYDEMCEHIEYLIKEKGLILRDDCPEKYFNAVLWGAPLSAARDSVLIFYKIQRDIDGNIFDIDFNFVVREEFEKKYDFVTK